MKKVLTTLFCLALGISVLNAQDKNPAKAPKPTTPPPAATAPAPKPAAVTPDPKVGIFKFVDSADTHNFGEVPEGPQAEWDFMFTNVGKKPIVITEAHGSCGCTVPTWPRDTIYPAKPRTGLFAFLKPKPKPKKYKIHVTYNTSGRQGAIMKEVIISSNAQQQPMTLHIRGFVKPKPQETKEIKSPAAVQPVAPPASAK